MPSVPEDVAIDVVALVLELSDPPELVCVPADGSAGVVLVAGGVVPLSVPEEEPPSAGVVAAVGVASIGGVPETVAAGVVGGLVIGETALVGVNGATGTGGGVVPDTGRDFIATAGLWAGGKGEGAAACVAAGLAAGVEPAFAVPFVVTAAAAGSELEARPVLTCVGCA